MTPLKQLYIVPVLAAVLIGVFLIWLIMPSDFFIQTTFILLVSLLVLAVGFRWITYHRITRIRDQIKDIIDTLEEFDIDEPRKVTFEKSPYPIINELNEYLIEIIDRVRQNYQANKQFTQNASHELQTPLAVIKGYVELLLQSPNMREKEYEALGAILQNTNRLSKLNAALILLSKIEHQRFTDFEDVNFNILAEEVLINFKDLLFAQEIEIQKKETGNFNIEMSAALAEILITNLIQNAIRHNESDFIEIEISEDKFQISNLGKPSDLKPQQLFKRFKRDSEIEESLGLGLSIIQRICEVSDLKVEYQIVRNRHIVAIRL